VFLVLDGPIWVVVHIVRSLACHFQEEPQDLVLLGDDFVLVEPLVESLEPLGLFVEHELVVDVGVGPSNEVVFAFHFTHLGDFLEDQLVDVVGLLPIVLLQGILGRLDPSTEQSEEVLYVFLDGLVFVSLSLGLEGSGPALREGVRY
jgi:hypothetical protein